MKPIDVVIMAAGKGTRMKSSIPKVLHRLAGKALLQHVVDAVAGIQARRVVLVTGHGAEQVQAALLSSPPETGPQRVAVLQSPQLGTGHAVQQALPELADDGLTLVLSGDVPLTQPATLQALIDASAGEHLALLTLNLSQPTGYGRVVRNAQQVVQAIVEEKDATEAQRALTEIYTGVLVAPTRDLRRWLGLLDNRNAQNEFYLTDVVKHAVAEGATVRSHTTPHAWEVAGVNSPAQLAELERVHQRRVADALMTQGVRLADPARLDVRGHLTCEADVFIDINAVFEGQVHLGEGVRIGPNCVLANCRIEAGAVIQAFTHIDGEKLGVSVGAGALVGPYARLRPGAHLGPEVHIGNFVEVKNSTLAAGAKANHLAYLGDATVGERVNYGAGSITANYDGANKHRTVIEADVHVGSNCVLVAPVTLGAGGTIGGGSTITKDTPAGALSVTRAKQVSLANWSRPVKTKP